MGDLSLSCRPAKVASIPPNASQCRRRTAVVAPKQGLPSQSRSSTKLSVTATNTHMGVHWHAELDAISILIVVPLSVESRLRLDVAAALNRPLACVTSRRRAGPQASHCPPPQVDTNRASATSPSAQADRLHQILPSCAENGCSHAAVYPQRKAPLPCRHLQPEQPLCKTVGHLHAPR